MRKKLVMLFGIMLLVTVMGTGITMAFSKNMKISEDNLNVVTSFYSVYIAAQNVIDGAEGIELVNLTENQTGCLHDYQLTTKDMRKLENADVFIINGGGMEGFIEEIVDTYPDITIINASEGIELEKTEEHEHNGHVHAGEVNAHVWLNVDNYSRQIENIKDELTKVSEKNKSIFERNTLDYIKKVSYLKSYMDNNLCNPINTKAVIFHDAFLYLLEYLNVSVVHAVDMDGETSLSAGEIGEIIDEIKENEVKVIFTEEQFSSSMAERISEETGAKVYVMDSLVSGEFHKEAYIRGMKNNIEVLKEALFE